MKTKTYTVTIRGLHIKKVQIEAKNAPEAKKRAEEEYIRFYGKIFEKVTSHAVADKKE